jgi:hypothetical protein
MMWVQRSKPQEAILEAFSLGEWGSYVSPLLRLSGALCGAFAAELFGHNAQDRHEAVKVDVQNSPELGYSSSHTPVSLVH